MHSACFASGGVLENELRASGVTVHDLAKREGLDFGLPGRLRRLIRAERIDVVHTNNFSPWLYVELACVGLPVRVVHTVLVAKKSSRGSTGENSTGAVRRAR